MNNERRFMPLRRYDVTFGEKTDSFEADMYERDDVSVRFLNSGNVIRHYFGFPDKIVVTPVE